MHQGIALILTLATAFLLHARSAAMQSADGNWGGALGQILIGPLVVFFVVHAVVYFVTRAIPGRAGVASFSASKLNYIAAFVAILGILGSVATPA